MSNKIKVTLIKSPLNNKRGRAIITNLETKEIKKVDFGSKSKKTFFDIGDETKKKNYLIRHKSAGNQDWSNIYTAGFWSRWFLWSHTKDNLNKIIQEIKNNVKGVKVVDFNIGSDFV